MTRLHDSGILVRRLEGSTAIITITIIRREAAVFPHSKLHSLASHALHGRPHGATHSLLAVRKRAWTGRTTRSHQHQLKGAKGQLLDPTKVAAVCAVHVHLTVCRVDCRRERQGEHERKFTLMLTWPASAQMTPRSRNTALAVPYGAIPLTSPCSAPGSLSHDGTWASPLTDTPSPSRRSSHTRSTPTSDSVSSLRPPSPHTPRRGLPYTYPPNRTKFFLPNFSFPLLPWAICPLPHTLYVFLSLGFSA